MRFIHLSDLHLGKRVNEYSMIEDQEYILKEIITIIKEQSPDAVIIAGDVYDKSVPSAEAVQLFDDFLFRLSELKLQVFVISGNHDSSERMAFGSRLMDGSGIHISRVYDGNIKPITLIDKFGPVNFYMLPFIKPNNVRKFFDDDIVTYTDAMGVAIKNMNVNSKERNVLITHQFVTGSSRSDSEEISVGGTDNVDVSVFDSFDYVALGHIHSPQNCGSERVRYSGTPLKYSFSEVKDKKSVTVVDMDNKGTLTINTIPLKPLHDMYEIKGTYNELTKKSFYENTDYPESYMHITLTDEEDIIDAISKLRVIYHNLMKLDYDNKRTRNNSKIDAAENVENKSPLELFSEFYELQNNQSMSDKQKDFVESLIENIWED